MRFRQRFRLRRLGRVASIWGVALGALGTFACGLDKLTSSTADPASLSAVVIGDSTLSVGGTAPLSVSTTHGVLPATSAGIVWSSDNPDVATVDASTGVVTAVAIGTANISATVVAPEIHEVSATPHAVRVRFAGIRIAPVDSLIAIGMTKAVVIHGTNTADSAVAAIPFSSAMAMTSRDTTVVALDANGALVAKANGTTRIVAVFDGAKDSITVKVRQVTRSIDFPAAVSGELPIQSIAKDRTLSVVARDSLGNSIAAPVVTWSTSDAATVAVVAGTGVAHGVKLGTATISATADGFSGTILARVTQVAASLSKIAGDGLTATAGSPTSAAPQVAVLDSGSTPIPGVTVTFSIVSGGGSVAGGAQTSDASTGRAAATTWTLGNAAGANSLKATAGGISTTFFATGTPGPATKLIFSTQPPSGVTAGQTLSVIRVVIADANGNTVTSATNTVSLAASATGTVGGTSSTNAVAGIAAFTALTMNTAGSFTLSATASGLTPATSNAVTVSGAAAAQVVFTTAPTANLTDTTFTPVIAAAVTDAFGNKITNGPTGSATMTISCTPTCTQSNNQSVASNGVATFPAYTVSTGGAYNFSVSAPSLASTQTSSAVTIASPTVATANFATNYIYDAVIYGDNIFYVDRNNSGGTVRQVSLSTGASITLASGPSVPKALATDGTSVWFTEDAGNIKRVAVGVDHGTITTVVSGLTYLAPQLATDGTWLFFWGAAGFGRQIMKVSTTAGSGTTPTVVVSPQCGGACLMTIAVSGTTLWYYDGLSNIKSVSTAGGATTTVVNNVAVPTSMVIGGGTLFWTDGTTLYTAPASATSVSQTSRPVSMGLDTRLGYDGASLYVMDPDAGKLIKVNTSTFATSTVVSNVNAATQVIAFDPNFVFYVDTNASMRLRRFLK